MKRILIDSRAAARAVVLGGLLLTAARPLGAQAPRPAPEYLVTVSSTLGFDETVRALKQAIEGENLMVVHEINPQQMLRMVGVRTGGMRQILFFHPRYMKRILEANRNGGIEPPLKLLVMEAPNGSVMVRYHDPVHQLAAYEGLEDVATELRAVIERIVSAVSR
ncbi:MAG: DUF302 domain-containing protein [Gemmatimonadales bacterium]